MQRVSKPYGISPRKRRVAVEELQALSTEAQTALAIVRVASQTRPPATEPCLVRLNALFNHKGRWAYGVFEDLMTRGIVHIARRDYREVYVLAPEWFDAVTDLMVRDVPATALPGSASREASDSFLQDLVIVAAQSHVGTLRTTRTGRMDRRSEAAVLDRLTGWPSTRLDWLLGEHVYSSQRLAWVVDAARTLGIMDSPQALEAFASAQRAQSLSAVDTWALGTLGALSPARMVLEILTRSPEDRFMKVHALRESVGRLSLDPFWAGIRRRLDLGLSLAWAMGWVAAAGSGSTAEVAILPRGRHALGARAPLASPGGTVILDADGTITATEPVDLEVLAALELCAECVTADRARIYRLTRGRAARALDLGLDLCRCMDLIVSAARTPLPRTVRERLQGWLARHGTVYLGRATLLMSDTAQHSRELEVAPRLRPFIRDRIGPLALLVSGPAEAIHEALEIEGELPRPGLVDLSADISLKREEPEEIHHHPLSAGTEEFRGAGSASGNP